MRTPSILVAAFLVMPMLTLAAPAVMRPLIVGLVEPVPDLSTVGPRLRGVVRLPVLRLTALSPGQISFTLKCSSTRQCDAAQARLRAATSWVKSVDLDAIRTRPTPASAAAARSL
jgi:hypothetical protein